VNLQLPGLAFLFALVHIAAHSWAAIPLRTRVDILTVRVVAVVADFSFSGIRFEWA
jgi:hypothetical protein